MTIDTSRQIHRVKILPRFFQAVLDGRKTYEVRRNDRDYTEGDLVVLVEAGSRGVDPTGRELVCAIGYVLELRAGNMSLGEWHDWCVFSLVPAGDSVQRGANGREQWAKVTGMNDDPNVGGAIDCQRDEPCDPALD